MDKRLVLLIDDDELMQAFYKDALAPYYYIRRALRGFRGIEAAKLETPDLVVVDIDMPEMNGFDFISAYRKATGLDTPFVVVSSYDNETFKSRAKALGVKLYLKKPVDDLHLVSAIETVFEMENAGLDTQKQQDVE